MTSRTIASVGMFAVAVVLAGQCPAWTDPYHADSVLKYDFDAGTNAQGLVEDESSVGTNDGTPYNVVFSDDATNGWAEFNGTNSYVTFPDSATVSPQDEDFTIMLWFNRSNADGYLYHDYRSEDTTDNHVWVKMTGTGQVKGHYGDDPNNVLEVTTPSAVNADEWHHVAWVLERVTNGAVASLYLDGTLVNSATNTAFSTIITSATPPPRIGARAADSQGWFEGSMDEIYIYKGRALSGSDVNEYYLATRDELFYNEPGTVFAF